MVGLILIYTDRDGLSPLHKTAKIDAKDVAKLLIESGANLDIQNRK